MSTHFEKRLSDAVFYRYTGDAEADNALFGTAFIDKQAAEGVRRFALNLERVSTFYSASINRLIEMVKAAEARGLLLALVSVPEKVRLILQTVRLDGKVRIYRSEYDFILDQNLAAPERTMGETREIVMFGINREVTGDEHVFHVQGALIEDYHSSELCDYVEAALRAGAKRIRVDLARTTFIDSINVGVFVRLRKMCLDKGAELCVANANPLVSDVFSLTGIGALICRT